MMHHSNVDRLWAYWEYMRPDMTHFTNTYYGQSRYDSPSNSIISADTKLTPFRQSDGSFWTTATTSNLEGQGYTYEGLEYWNKTREELQRDAIAVINKAYGSPQSFEKREAGSHATGFLSGKRHSDNGLANKRVATMFTQYFAVVDLDREDVEAPCAVNVYIAGKLAGSIPVMPQPETGNVKGRFIIDDAVEGAFARIGASETDSHVPDIDHMVEVDITRVSLCTLCHREVCFVLFFIC
jgi:tyrosinase